MQFSSCNRCSSAPATDAVQFLKTRTHRIVEELTPHSLYAQGYCRAMKQERELMPQHVLIEAWTKMQTTGVVGSCTTCLVSLHPHKNELLAGE